MHEGVNAEASWRFHVVEPGGRGGAHTLGSVCFPMRLWIVTPVTLAHGRSGDIEHYTELLATGLSARGHEVTVVTTAHPDGRITDRMGDVELVYVPGSSSRTYEPQWWADTYARLRAAHAEQPVDAVVSFSAGALGWVAPARTELGVPTVVVLHGSLGGELRRTWREARTVRPWYRLARLAGRTAPLLLGWRRAAPAVAAWAPVSQAVAAESRRELGIPSDRVTVVPACVDVVPPGDPEALARAIEELLADGARRREPDKQARVHAEQRFSQAVAAETVEKLLVEVAARQSGHGWPGRQ